MLAGIQRLLGSIALAALTAIFCGVAMLAVVETYSRFFLYQPGDAERYSVKRDFLSFYTNFVSHTGQMIGPQHFRGVIPSEGRQYPGGFDIHVNKFGFFTEFPVDAFPLKASNEYRIVLIGASGAQGHGARTNADMFYSLIEQQLNDLLSPQTKIRVINLAQPGDMARQSLEILRGFAHPLDPDMILAYSGHPDITEPMESGIFMSSSIPSGIQDENRSYPWYLEWLVRLFPRTMLRHGVGPKLRGAFDENRFRLRDAYHFLPQIDLGLENQNSSNKTDPKGFYYDHVVSNIVNSFKAMKREFCGLPIVIVRGITGPPDQTNTELEKRYHLTGKLNGRFLDEWWRLAKAQLTGYINGQWYFLDAEQDIWSRYDPKIQKLSWLDGTKIPITGTTFNSHLDNLGQRLFAQWLVPKLELIIRKTIAERPPDRCEAYFRSH